MADFVVLDVDKKDRRVALRDHRGRHHVARVVDAMPAIGAELIGTYPGHGPRVLVAESNGEVFRVTFDAMDGGPHAGAGSLHE